MDCNLLATIKAVITSKYIISLIQLFTTKIHQVKSITKHPSNYPMKIPYFCNNFQKEMKLLQCINLDFVLKVSPSTKTL